MINRRVWSMKPALLAAGLLLLHTGCSSSNEAGTSEAVVSDATAGDSSPSSNDFDQAYQEAAQEDSNRAQDPLPEKDVVAPAASTGDQPSADADKPATDPDLSSAPAAQDTPAAVAETPAPAEAAPAVAAAAQETIAPAEDVPDYQITEGSASPTNESVEQTLSQVPVQEEVKQDAQPEAAPVASPDVPAQAEMSAATPAPEVAATQEAVSGDESEYIVQPGDNLADIAKRLYGNRHRYKELASMNHLKHPKRLHPGDVIRFKLDDRSRKFAEVYRGVGMKTVQVKKGDTLSRIAKRTLGNSAYWKSIWKMNKDVVSNPNRLEVGMTLKYYSPRKLTQALQKAGLEVVGSH